MHESVSALLLHIAGLLESADAEVALQDAGFEIWRVPRRELPDMPLFGVSDPRTGTSLSFNALQDGSRRLSMPEGWPVIPDAEAILLSAQLEGSPFRSMYWFDIQNVTTATEQIIAYHSPPQWTRGPDPSSFSHGPHGRLLAAFFSVSTPLARFLGSIKAEELSGLLLYETARPTSPTDPQAP